MNKQSLQSTLSYLDSLPPLDTPSRWEDTSSSISSLQEQTEQHIIELPEGELDPRIKLLSYSSTLTLHACPRKYQLYKLGALQKEIDTEQHMKQSVTFAYGHVVGQGLQDILEHSDLEKALFNAFLMWEPDLEATDSKNKKSFWTALVAIYKFAALREQGYLSEYELMYFEGKPAVELGFIITFSDGFKYRGFVDAVLRHKVTGAIVVLEAKTTGMRNINAVAYKNSAQAIGYSIVLDFLVPGLSSYTVLYLVYSSTAQNYTELPFDKTLLQRAQWLRNLLLDKKKIELYNEYGEDYPMYGESCNDYFRECAYYGLCTLPTESLAKPLTQEILSQIEEDDKKYQFKVSFEELIDSQIQHEPETAGA